MYINAPAPVPPFVIADPMFVVPDPASRKVLPVLSFDNHTGRVLNDKAAPPAKEFVNRRSAPEFWRL
jgi:hypothetical protein